jgi:hypothetical protein
MRELALSMLLLFLDVQDPASAPPGYEAQPVLKAVDLVPGALLKGPKFTVDPRVPTTSYLAQFTLRSEYGTLEVHGRDLLAIRVAEVGALEQLVGMSKSEEFLKASDNAAARPVKAGVDVASSPAETAKGAPAAVGRFFERIELGARGVSSGSTSPGKTTEQKAEETSKRVGSIGVDVLGYEQERRALAKRLNVDPYTTNPVLSEKLTDTAWVTFSGRLGVSGLTAVIVPFSSVLALTSATRDLVWDTPPRDLVLANQKRFAATGASEEQVRALMANRWYSLTILTHLALGLDGLAGITGREHVVAFAGHAQSEDIARLTAGAVAMLQAHHAKGQPLAQILVPGPIAARGRDGSLVVPVPLDYVAWTDRVARFAKRRDFEGKARVALIPGAFSPRAKKDLTAGGWTLREGTPPVGYSGARDPR